MSLPDVHEVRTREDFVRFVQLLRLSLERALSMPPPSDYEDQRGDWTNWNGRDPFTEAMIGWLEGEPWSAAEVADALLRSFRDEAETSVDDVAEHASFLDDLHAAWPAGRGRITALEREPIAGILFNRHAGSPPEDVDLSEHLAAIERWASVPRQGASADMWRRAAVAMVMGARYELWVRARSTRAPRSSG